MTHITEASRTVVEGLKDKVANSDIIRKWEGKLSKAESAIRLGRLSAELAIHRIDMVKSSKMEVEDIHDILLKTKRELVKNLIAIKKFERMMK